MFRKNNFKNKYKNAISYIKKNKKKSLIVSASMLSLIIIISIGIYVSLGRVGFNLNVVYQQNIPEEAWYTKLVTGKAYDNLSYELWDGSISESFASGSGSKKDPFIISTASELAYLDKLMNTRELVRKIDGSACRNNYLTHEIIKDYERRGNFYHGTITYTITNSTDHDLKNLVVNFRAEDTITDISLNGKSISFTKSGTEISFYDGTDLLAKESLQIVISYRSLIADYDITDFSYTLSDQFNDLYYPSDDCEYRYYDTSDKYFKITNNLDFNNKEFAGIGSKEIPFEGTIDADFHHFKNLIIKDEENEETHYTGLFNYVNDAVIKNFLFEKATLNINGLGINHAGLLVGYANGTSKIYNNGIISGEINVLRNTSANMYLGSLVGYLSGTSIVTNSYSYANITSKGLNNTNMIVGGIVGYRTGNNNTLNDENPKVYLLVMYGSINIKNCKSYQYVYNGTRFDASSSPTYCYYLWMGDTIDTNSGIDNTYAVFKSYDDMIADGFKAHLNSYRFMVNYYVGNDSKIKDSATEGYSDIAYWYTKNSESYYPVLAKHSNSPNKIYTNYTTNVSDAIARFGSNNYVKVNLVNNSVTNQNKTIYIKITEKDEDNNDYTNHKIVLPFNSQITNYIYGTNGKNGNYMMSLSGWKLTEVVENGKVITKQTLGSEINYNYALRKGSGAAGKDINTIYAEGGYYLVPSGVSEITLTTHWAYTIYAKDAFNDMVYEPTYRAGDSSIYQETNAHDSNSGLTPNDPVATLNQAYAKVGNINKNNRSTIYDVIIMLVGNLHYSPSETVGAGANITNSTWAYNNTDRPVTIMSIDENGDLEPDYALYTRNVHDQEWPSLRFNFVSILSIPQVGTINAKLNAMTMKYDAELEVSETTKTDRIDIRHYQAKYIKINGGYWDIYSVWSIGSQSLRKNYIYFGGNAKAIYLNSGCESRQLTSESSNPLPVFVITGGRIETLSANYFGTVVAASNDVYFYIDGGYIDKFYTTYNSSLNKKAVVNVNNSYINTYYAGGHTESSVVRGGVTSNFTNSRVGSLYGGPEYGSIEEGSTINVESSIIDHFFGSGYGGTQTTEINLVYQDAGASLCSSSNYYYNITNNCNRSNSSSMSDANRTYCFGRKSDTYGIETAFYSTTYTKSGCAAKAFATYYSSLSAANVDKVTVNINDSTVNGDFYGGGNKGKVDKSIVVNMSNTTIKGNLYGGGLSNETETLEVFENTNGYVAPRFKSYTVDVEATYPQKHTYTWSGNSSLFSSGSVINTTDKLIYSENDGKLGNVNGEIVLNITASNIKGSIYGGGNLSEVIGNINLNIKDDTIIGGNIYGGGNKAKVTGSTDVRLLGITSKNVYGGGEEGDVDGNTSVTILQGSKVTNLYGGGNKASVTKSETYITNGTVSNVYGGSNISGQTDDSSVYAGALNPDPLNDGSIPSEEESPIDPPSNPDVCNDPNIRLNVKLNSNYLNVTVTNETDVTFNKYNIIITTKNVSGIGSNWSGSTASYSNNTVTITEKSLWWGTNTINAGGTRTLSDNSLSLNGSGIEIIAVYMTATGSDGKTYTTDDCNDPIPEPEPEPEPDPTPTPDPDIKINAVITNIYGGNNEGGQTISSHVYVEDATINNVYGGGNLVPSTNTDVNVRDLALILENVYGGGNYGIISEATNVNISGGIINGSVYAGGNGTGATVVGNTNLTIENNPQIKKHVFGGGNAAETGTSAKNDSISKSHIYGGTILGNVYGGANTSKIWGSVELSIGSDNAEDKDNEITILGTVFGGGEANAAGSENYDYSYISVTKGIDININSRINNVTIGGSIFGSGNASSTSGYSNIKLISFGTREIPKKIISLQRAGNVLLDNSSLDIKGTTDRTNEFSSIIYSLSRVDHLTLANNSTLYLQSGTNVLKQISSELMSNETREYSKVTIENDEIIKNVDNRIYMYINKSLNIINSENLLNGTFGNVNGMIFFGLYEQDRSNNPDTGIYNESYKTGSVVSNDEIYKFTSGSYVMGIHKELHDYKVDGFYTNYVSEDGNIKTDYINPTPEDADYYQWIVGEASTTFNLSLTASKFATMGTDELALIGFNKPNTYFEIVSYNDNDLASGVSLLDEFDIPRVAATDEDSMNNFGLKMTSSNVGWTTDGKTSFLSTNEVTDFTGTNKYISANSTDIPSLYFYFLHSKNITEDKKLGTVTIAMLGYIPIDEVTYEVKRIYIEVALDTKFFETDNYESSMTPGKEYELFVNNKTNITSSSSLSAYFSLYVKGTKSIYKEGFHRTLSSSVKLPLNTRITLIDRTIESIPVYYYFVVNEENIDIVKTQISSNAFGIDTTFYLYNLSDFVRMGSTTSENRYNDAEANKKYYQSSTGISEEEFIFIVDYSETSITENIIGAELLLELKDEDDYTNYASLGVSHANMVYSVFANEEAKINIDLTSDRDIAYAGYEFNMMALMNFVEPTAGLIQIKDTNYTQDKMGLKISLYDSKGLKVNGASLLGTIFYINGVPYSARLDGSIRVKISDFVANVRSNIRVDLTKSMLATDTYKIVLESFGSPDGLYYGLTSSGSSELLIEIINENYGLLSLTNEENVIINSKTGTNTANEKDLTYEINYTSQLANPNIRVKLFRRKYDEIYSKSYEEVDLQDYVSDTLNKADTNEYFVTSLPTDTFNFTITLRENLVTGTYKIVFELYNKDNYIDSVSNYLIIK